MDLYDDEEKDQPFAIPPELLARVAAQLSEDPAAAQEARDAATVEQLKGLDESSRKNATASLIAQGFDNATAGFLRRAPSRLEVPKVDENVRTFLAQKAQRKAPGPLDDLVKLAQVTRALRPPGEKASKPDLFPTQDYIDRGQKLKRKVIHQPGEAPKDFAKRVEDQEAAETGSASKEKTSGAESVIALRKEFNSLPAVKDMETAATAYQKVKTTSESGAGDISLIFAYMKMLDPGSTVREGEFATAATAGSIPQTVVAAYNKAVNGEKLDAGVRAMFKSEARKVYDATKKRYQLKEAQFRKLASKYGMDPEDVVGDLGLEPDSPAPGSPGAPPEPGRPGDKYLKR